ncbi:MAG: minor capsid protein [Thermoguttaceae bacterium]|nr:minor capsid protein [Thermoguttaceae bacterium]
MAKKTSLEKLLGYQTRLQGVANDLATRLRELLDAADDETLAMLRREYKTATGDVKSRIRAIQKLVVALEKARATSFAEAETLAVETGRSVAEIASDATLAEIYPLLNAAERLDAERSKRRAAEVEERRRRLKPLSAKQIDAILNWSPIQGASIAQWFERWRENDLRRIVDEVQTGAVESLSVYELTRKIRGTKANGYADGILQTSRRSAETVARTVINGVSNEARFATLCENDDVLDGIQFLATLDGRTSFVCASLDGKIWRGDEMEKAARPPLHPNCRSTLIPYIELRDPETGEIIDESEDLLDENGNVVVRALTRAAANADFNKLAEESYNKTAREKGLKKRWDDLSPSTRKKYYYQAQRDWEKANGGENAYRQVPASTTFKVYFETQPEAFQRSWLGAKRFELWKSGRLKFEDLGKPASSYRARLEELNPAATVAGFVESVKNSGDFWPDDEKPSNGKRYRAALDKAQRRAEKSGDFDAEELKEIREALIFENMRRNEAEARAILAKEGREILPLEKRENHFIIEARNLPTEVKKFPSDKGIVGPCTVDRYENGELKQRRWYDANGVVEQDYDAAHSGEDVNNSHIFPHLHAWIKKTDGDFDRSENLPVKKG